MQSNRPINASVPPDAKTSTIGHFGRSRQVPLIVTEPTNEEQQNDMIEPLITLAFSADERLSLLGKHATALVHRLDRSRHIFKRQSENEDKLIQQAFNELQTLNIESDSENDMLKTFERLANGAGNARIKSLHNELVDLQANMRKQLEHQKSLESSLRTIITPMLGTLEFHNRLVKLKEFYEVSQSGDRGVKGLVVGCGLGITATIIMGLFCPPSSACVAGAMLAPPGTMLSGAAVGKVSKSCIPLQGFASALTELVKKHNNYMQRLTPAAARSRPQIQNMI